MQDRFVTIPLTVIAFALVGYSVYRFGTCSAYSMRFFRMLGPNLSEIDRGLVWSKRLLAVMAMFQLSAFAIGPFSPEWSAFIFMLSLVWMAVSAQLNSDAWRLLVTGMRSIGKRTPP